MYTVVIADGEAEFRRALVQRIDWEAAGFCVAGEARDGLEALDMTERLEPDLLVADVRMPLLSGIELARMIRERGLGTQIVFLSGFDDFVSAQQAIECGVLSYLLKPISSKEFTGELKKIRRKLDERLEERGRMDEEQRRLGRINFFVPLLLDPFSEETGRGKGAAAEREAGYYVVLAASLRDEKGENQTKAEDVESFNQVLGRYIPHISFHTGGRVVSLLLAEDFLGEETLCLLAGEISRSIQCNLKTSVGVSREFSTLRHCHRAYLEAVEALECACQKGVGIFFISEADETDNLSQEAVQTVLDEIERILRNGTKGELKHCLEDMFDRLKQKHPSVRTIQWVMIQMLAMAVRTVGTATGRGAAKRLEQSAPLPGQMLFESLDEVRESSMAFCLKAAELMEGYRKRSSSLLCDRALAVIDSHFMEPELSLRFISREVSVSPNYLSTLIKRSTGCSFIEMLTRKRMDMAKELLLGTNMKIREIAEKCGYRDQHYFSYCFKKYEGISPNVYRRNHTTQSCC